MHLELESTSSVRPLPLLLPGARRTPTAAAKGLDMGRLAYNLPRPLPALFFRLGPTIFG